MKILMLAYYFPPDSSSGSLRPLYFADYFQSRGDRVDLITARVGDFLPDQNVDWELVPRGIRIHRSRVFRPREFLIHLKQKITSRSRGGQGQKHGGKDSPQQPSKETGFTRFKDMITTMLASPDPQAGWLLPAFFKGLQVVAENRPHVIYATGGPWTGLLAAALLKIKTQIPLVLDFRDPWTRNPPFAKRPGWIRQLEKRMEKFAVSRADLIVANTHELGLDFMERFDLDGDRVVTVSNGYARSHGDRGSHGSDPGVFELTHAGSLYFSRNPKNLLKAVLELVEEGRITDKNFRLNFVGGISIDDPELDGLLAQPSLNGILNITPRLPLAEAMAYQRNSDVQFLIQLDFPLQVPRKLYDAMPAGRPVLAITEANGATARVVRETGMGRVVENHVEGIKAGLLELIDLWEKGQLNEMDGLAIEAYENRALCRTMRSHLGALCSSHRQSGQA
ncbi:MAG: glycosyltransferase family 4 protein [Desulfobacterales bacterium]|nr:glycosyltransferase family 4 protein [Desulfobacterales bacterium]